jgi:peptidoglycan/LPS O-acetylase OafA/YrhL
LDRDTARLLRAAAVVAGIPRSHFSMKQLLPLTGLRGVAACLVLLSHAIDISFHYDIRHFGPYIRPLAQFGMSLFFVLSGFVIQYNYAESFRRLPLRAAARRFYVARFARLYPLYAVSILISLPMIPTPFSAWINLSYLTLTQSWFNVELGIFPADWSVSTEWFFYLAFVPLTALVTRARRPFAILIAFCIFVALFLCVAFTTWRDAITAIAQRWVWYDAQMSASAWDWISYFSPYTRLFEFVAGMLAARCFQIKSIVDPRALEWSLKIGLAWCAVVYVGSVADLPILNSIAPNFGFAPGIVLVMLAVCCLDGAALTSILSSRTALFLGEISYSIYIWLFFASIALGGTLAGAHPITIAYFNWAIQVMAICGVTIMAAYGSYLLIERPSRRWLRERLAGLDDNKF